MFSPLLQSAQPYKELFDLYWHFSGTYLAEVEAHHSTTEQLAERKAELVSTESKLKAVNTDLDKVKSDLDVANKKIDGHALTLANKDTELQKFREELKEARDRELDAVAVYQESMDFVTRVANRYNGGWSPAMRCARYAIPDLDWVKVEDAHGR